MKQLIIIAFSIIFLCCSHIQRATGFGQEEGTLSSLIIYRNVYNKYGKLEAVFTDKKNFYINALSSSWETRFIYKNDTVLLREEEYKILPDGDKELTSYCIFDENSEKYFFFNGKDTVGQSLTQYENGLTVYNRSIHRQKYWMENTETIYYYDSVSRISQIKIIDFDKGITIIGTHKYDMIGDTLITDIFIDNVLNRTEKKVKKDNYSMELFYDDQNHLVSSTENTQIDSENNLSVRIDYENNFIDSTFYNLDKKVKTVSTEHKRDGTIISIDEIDKNKGHSLEELLNIFAGPMNKQTVLYEYDEFGNITKEAQYEDEGNVDN
jgi:hypothetical protein